jgi:hypothetical protein
MSTTWCTAVGVYENTSGFDRTCIESWNGSKWTIQSNPNNGTGNNQLNGMTCKSDASCEAVGDYENSSNVAKTLVESYR